MHPQCSGCGRRGGSRGAPGQASRDPSSHVMSFSWGHERQARCGGPVGRVEKTGEMGRQALQQAGLGGTARQAAAAEDAARPSGGGRRAIAGPAACRVLLARCMRHAAIGVRHAATCIVQRRCRHAARVHGGGGGGRRHKRGAGRLAWRCERVACAAPGSRRTRGWDAGAGDARRRAGRGRSGLSAVPGPRLLLGTAWPAPHDVHRTEADTCSACAGTCPGRQPRQQRPSCRSGRGWCAPARCKQRAWEAPGEEACIAAQHGPRPLLAQCRPTFPRHCGRAPAGFFDGARPRPAAPPRGRAGEPRRPPTPSSEIRIQPTASPARAGHLAPASPPHAPAACPLHSLLPRHHPSPTLIRPLRALVRVPCPPAPPTSTALRVRPPACHAPPLPAPPPCRA